MDNFNRKAIFILLIIGAVILYFISRALIEFSSRNFQTYNQNPPKSGLAIKIISIQHHGEPRKCGHDISQNSQITAQAEITNYTSSPIMLSLSDCRAQVYSTATSKPLDINALQLFDKPSATDIRIITPNSTHPITFKSHLIPLDVTGDAKIILTIAPISIEALKVATEEQKSRFHDTKQNDIVRRSLPAKFHLNKLNL